MPMNKPGMGASTRATPVRRPLPVPAYAKGGEVKKDAGAGRGFVNPRRTDESDEDYVSPKQRYEMEKEVEERRTQKATDKAYNKAAGYAKGGFVRAADGIAKRGKTRGRMV